MVAKKEPTACDGRPQKANFNNQYALDSAPAFKSQPPAPSVEFQASVHDRTFADIHDVADEIRSLATSIREAAFRRDSIWIRIHRAEFREQAVLFLGLVNDLALLEGEKTAAQRGAK